MERANGRRRYLERASSEYHDQLKASAASGLPDGARDYFRDHCITPAIAEKYRLGLVIHPLPGDYRFTGMISIPYLARHGGPTTIRFRNTGSRHSGKYAVHTGTKHRLYNTKAFHTAGEMIGITEGEFDAIVATEILGLPSVGVPGATNWDSRLWKWPFRDFQAVVILADGDEAGRDFAKQVAEDIGWRSMIAQCPDGEDVSSMAFQGREAELRALYQSTSNEEAA